MRRHPRTTAIATGALLAACSLAVPGLGTGAAGAAPPPVTGHPATEHTAAATAEARQRAAAFWTPERMRSATPLDITTDRPASPPAPVPAGARHTTVAPTTAHSPAAVRSFPQAGGPWTGGGAVVKTSGRVFFTMQGRTASCSGDAVTSGNGSTVLTAGHCVKYQGNWHTNWTFVPGYHDGQAPYGTWAATKTLSTPQWTASEDMNNDIGAAVVGPLDGKRLTDVVGGQGLDFNGGYNKPMYSFGFPAASPYDGTKLIHCSGNTTKDFLLTKDHGLSCNMTGGSSGGPWFTSFDESTGTGLQASVNSFGYTFLPNTMFGPYFGDVAKTLYDQAQTS
ncbi:MULTISPECIES: trypsin-like serine peptidase [Streptomyces]|uniref:trypsin-like serine peptidase n=1 Tax=Streptomyces TaxID=1883 RepID=UPI00163B7C3B|nr:MULTISPECIES: peptidase [Streptomyces]MBC2875460.1 peptidase [Streptomyces sp. TYQ1024]UBI35700.1 peptidase [Streptomyces mobaraensis]UKW28293.1 peptidase [Streptomyces sp. TYQ1024]